MKKLYCFPIWVVVGVAGTLLASCGGGGDEVSEDTTMERLETKGFSFSIDEYQRAAREGDLETVLLFQEAGMEVDAAAPNGMTALFVAADNGQAEVVEALADKGADVNVQLAGGNTPLLAAAANGHAPAAKVLLEKGANPEARDGHNWTPLTRAAFEGHSEAVGVLAPKSRTELDAALHLASVNGNTQTVDALLNAGASVFARSNENKTALMYAAANGNFDVVKVLLQNGSNRFAIDENGKTPAQIAELEGHVAVADYLLEPPTDEERSMPEIPAIADLTPEKDEFTPGDVAENPSFSKVKNGVGSEPVLANRQPTPRRINGSIVAANIPVEIAGAGPVQGDEFDEGAFGEGDLSAPEPATEASGVQSGAGAFPAAGGIRLAGGHDPVGEVGEAVHTGAAGQDGGVVPTGGSGNSVGGIQPTGSDFHPSVVALPQETVEAVATKLRMHDYRESQLPVMLDDVVDETATVRVLYGDSDAVEVKAGEQIGETGLEVVEVRRRFITSKQGKGDAVNVSEMEIRDVRSGERILVVKDVPAKANATYALMSMDGSGELYDVRRDDHFSAEIPDRGLVKFRVADVRPTQVVLEEMQSGESFTIPRTTYGL